jgi:ectoine hydroxylase-related dioxygenase (phytanoyl-CoA dioxygenase family)
VTIGIASEELASQIVHDGYALAREVLDRQSIARLIAAVDTAAGDRAYGLRNLLRVVPATAYLAVSADMKRLVTSVLGEAAFPVGGILFDKSAAANWLVPWHQDVTIRVRSRSNLPGFGPWSVKAGVVHVQPPSDILDRMVAVRVHLDPCGADNGALRVLPRTHRSGRLSDSQIDAARRAIDPLTCEADAGDVLLMKPLLLHASSASERPAHRRVIHLEYAACQLPGGLEWAESGI